MLGGGINGSGGPEVCGDCIMLYIKQKDTKCCRKQSSCAFIAAQQTDLVPLAIKTLLRETNNLRGRNEGVAMGHSVTICECVNSNNNAKILE